jgi:peptidoglycan/xylan/chitin deacetylase (PgdA/CDA1 family)
MIECIFTIDYEIYGNGEGSLKELVYEPTQRLKDIFDRAGAKIVVFVETAELEKIETTETDFAIKEVKRQLQELYVQGHEIALHLHPQWCNARYLHGKWVLDYSEYNLCALPEKRIDEIVDRSITYLRTVLAASDFTPLSFRAGNWLFQPTATTAKVLERHGIKIDSSVYKGGLQHQYKLDYRRAEGNGYFWRFQSDVNTPEPNGVMLEIPIYTRMVPFWKMATSKRVGLQQKGSSGARTAKQRLYRLQDRARFWHPLKFDFCRMTINELTRMVDTAIIEDQLDSASFKPLVAIGHTKDLVDFETVELFLSYLGRKRIAVSPFGDVYHRCK